MFLKKLMMIFLLGLLAYSAALIIIRLKRTQLAYQFEDLKTYERSLNEEQAVLRARLSKRLSPEYLKAIPGFQPPRPEQVQAIP